MGLLSEKVFLDTLAQYGGTPATLRQAWNAMLLGLPAHRLALLTELRQAGYGVYLLSNTNQTHLNWVREYLQREYDCTDFDTRYFDRVYYSHLLHRRKPDVATYTHVLQDAGIRAEDTLFIDDNAANVEGARAAGLQAHHHADGRDVEEVVQEWRRE